MRRGYDAVVAGGGLAGALGARALSERGLRVLVVERKQDPGDFNYCAEAVSARAIAPFEAFGADLVASPIDGGILVGPGGIRCRFLYPGVGYVLHRDRLMRRVYEQALAAGAEGRLGCELMEVHRDRHGAIEAVGLRSTKDGNSRAVERVQCRALLAADGVAGGVGRLAGIDTRLAVGEVLSSAQYRLTGIDVEEAYPEFWIGDEFAPGGYAWVFPRSPTEANVGVGMVADRPSAQGRVATQWLKQFHRQRFKVPGKIESYITGGIPTLLRTPPSAAQGVVLAGDAVRGADPLSAAGIAEAMDSGRRAGLCLAEALDAGDLSERRLSRAHEGYRKAHPRLRAMGAIRRIFDRLDDGEKAQLVAACRRAFHGRRVDEADPVRLFAGLLKSGPGLLGYARYLVGL